MLPLFKNGDEKMQDIVKKIKLSKIEFEDTIDENGNVVDTQPVQKTREYMMILNINVIEKLEDKYASEKENGIKNWLTRISESGEGQYLALIDAICETINEGIRLENKHRQEVGLTLKDRITRDDIQLNLVEMLELITPLIKDSLDTGAEKN